LKKLTLIVVVLLACQAAFSQAIIDSLSNSLCACIHERKQEIMAPGKKIDLKAEVTQCMVSIFTEKIGEIQAAYKDSFALTENFGEKIGIEIGKRALATCPDFLDIAMQAAKDNDEDEAPDENAQTFSVSGVLKEVKAGALLTFKVKGDNGKEVSLLVMHNGEGISEFLSQHDTYINKQVKVYYTISEIYNPATKEFELKKEVTKIELP